VQEEKERKRLQKLVAEGKPIPAAAPFEKTKPPRQRIAHFVMNLPDSAIQFLDAFRGLLSDAEGRDLSGIYKEMPMVHCHCFTRELELKKAERDIRQVSQFILSQVRSDF
jgi:tRNA (guanine37-N1)-methyltransferase